MRELTSDHGSSSIIPKFASSCLSFLPPFLPSSLFSRTNCAELTMLRKIVPTYVLAATAASLGGFLNGYDTGGIGAIMQMRTFKDTIGYLSPSMIGFTVSLIMLTGALPSVFAGHLADKLGRIKVIMAGAIIFGIGAIIQGSAYSLAQFNVGRALSGFGEGVYLSNVSVYIAEIAPVAHRGVLAGLPQFMSTSGVCIGYFTCYGSVKIPSSLAWRTPYVIQGALTAIYLVCCLVLPESPRWLMLHGRSTEALEALKRLDFSMDEAQRDFLTVTEQSPSISPWQSFLLLFKRGYRQRTILALFVLGMVQLSGIDGVLYVSAVSLYSPLVLTLR